MLESLELVYFPGDKLFWNFIARLSFRELYFLGGFHIFLAHNLQQKQFFISFIFHKDLMKMLYFPRNSSIFFLWSYPTVQEFRMIDYVILVHATVLGMMLNGLGKGNISTVYYIFNSLKSKTFLKVLFTMITVNKDLE